MNYKYLADTGVQVSSLCFGTMSFGGDADEKTSINMFNRCRDAGIIFFDCANVYNGGLAEEILGKLTRDCRSEMVLTSKVYFPTGDDMNARGASRKHIFDSIHKSLKRLQSDYLDIYFIHRFDDNTSLIETLSALDDLVRQGKILYIGASNFAAWQVMKAQGISAQNGLSPIKCLQPMYNLVKRQAEVEILPMAQSENVSVISYSPLGGGLLTGKYGVKDKPKSGRLLENKMYVERYRENYNFEVAEQFSKFANEHGMNPVSLAVAWVASHPAITAPIIGARNLNQLEDSLKSVDIEMTDELRSEISKLSIEPAPATDRSDEKTGINFMKLLMKKK